MFLKKRGLIEKIGVSVYSPEELNKILKSFKIDVVQLAMNIFDQRFNQKDFYFVHSYIYRNISKTNILATTYYGKNFPSVINKGNIYGVQFHPEKSHKYGVNLIRSFINDK